MWFGTPHRNIHYSESLVDNYLFNRKVSFAMSDTFHELYIDFDNADIDTAECVNKTDDKFN